MSRDAPCGCIKAEPLVSAFQDIKKTLISSENRCLSTTALLTCRRLYCLFRCTCAKKCVTNNSCYFFFVLPHNIELCLFTFLASRGLRLTKGSLSFYCVRIWHQSSFGLKLAAKLGPSEFKVPFCLFAV